MKPLNRSKLWILLFLALALMALGGIYAAKRLTSPAAIARITVDGETYREIDLQAVTIPYEFVVETEFGSNTVRVEHGRISVISADCPDKICVQRGWAEDSLLPIVCLPHRLVIQLEDGQ